MESKNVYPEVPGMGTSVNPPPYPGPPSQDYRPQPIYTAPGVYPHPQNQPQMVQATVIPAVVPAVVVTRQMGPKPSPYVCKSCHQQIVTRVESKPTMRTHFFALFLCILGCWPCMCLPYCMDDCMSADHYCPNCNSYVGSYIN